LVLCSAIVSADEMLSVKNYNLYFK
jgi:hypothetical protein